MPPEGSRNQGVRGFLSGLGPTLTSVRVLSHICALHHCPDFLHPFLPPLIGRLSSYQSFLDILNETNDYAGQRELIAENMMMNICIDLTKYLQELKQERKTVSFIWRGPGSVLVWAGKVPSLQQPVYMEFVFLQVHLCVSK